MTSLIVRHENSFILETKFLFTVYNFIIQLILRQTTKRETSVRSLRSVRHFPNCESLTENQSPLVQSPECWNKRLCAFLNQRVTKASPPPLLRFERISAAASRRCALASKVMISKAKCACAVGRKSQQPSIAAGPNVCAPKNYERCCWIN